MPYKNFEMNRFLFLFFLFCALTSYAQQPDFNLELIGQNGDYSNDQYNDIWGWVDSDGVEYAIIGSRTATIVYSLEDPANPQEVYYVPGATSLWRDMKNWGDFVYVTTDVGTDGLLIIDMSGAPENITHEFWTPTLTVDNETAPLETCHNLYIDENGYCYLAGCNLNDGGPLILDVATTPGEPVLVGHADRRYSHDVYARGDTLWSSDILDGFFSVVDVTDKANPVTMAITETSFFFTHNAWLSDDGDFLFTTDERNNANVDSYDVSDLNDIRRMDTFRPQATEGTGVIPHNTHYHNGFLVTSWYIDGVKVTDVHRPSNMIEVGSYDTYSGNLTDFNGCWGVYPFLPSGLIIAADINSGLYVFEPNYVRACYLEGTVTDANSGAQLFDVKVDIVETDLEKAASTDLMGEYKTGLAEAGEYTITFTKAGYIPFTTTATLDNGVVTIVDATLQLLPNVDLTGKVIDANTQAGIPNAKVLFANEEFSFELSTDANGEFEVNSIFIDTYNVVGGAWGYLHEEIEGFEVTVAEEVIIELSEFGYQDDFVLDFEWTTDSQQGTSSGFWVREIPNGTIFGNSASNPFEDLDNDIGERCYVTGNSPQSGAGNDDIDNGLVRLTSPSMDLSNYGNPILSHNLWFFNEGGSTEANDSLRVLVSNGPGTEVVVEVVTESNREWRPRSEIDLTGLIDLSQPVRVIYEASDLPGFQQGHISEAAVDAFAVLDGAASNTNLLPSTAYQLNVSPNPFATQAAVDYQIMENFKDARLHLSNALGQRLSTFEIEQSNGQLEIGQQLIPGVYFLQLEVDGSISNAGKLIKIAE